MKSTKILENFRLNPTNDFMFKKIFGNKDKKEYLLAFLNAIIGDDFKCKLVDLEIIENKELNREYSDEKLGILDIVAKLADNTIINIEMQVNKQTSFVKRAMFYLSKLYSDSIKKGDNYEQLSDVVQISILDFDHFNDDRFIRKFKYTDQEVYSDNLNGSTLYFVELTKVRKYLKLGIKQHLSELGDHNNRLVWLSWLAGCFDTEDLKELVKKESLIKEVEVMMEMQSLNDDERRIYDLREKYRMDAHSIRLAGVLDGIEIGREEGIEIGREEGIRNQIKSLTKFNVSKNDIVESIMNDYDLTHDEVIKYFE